MKNIVIALALGCCLLTAAAQKNIDQGLVAFYSYNGNANDYSGNNYHGVAYGVWPVADHNGIGNQAYYFDGIASKINVAKDEFVTDVLSVSFWLRITANNTFRYCIACSDFSLFTEGDSVGMCILLPLEKRVKGYAGMNTWTNVVGTFDNYYIRLYINGTMVDSVFHQGLIFDSNWELIMGAFGSNYWEGELDDIRIYNRVLSKADVTELWGYYGVQENAATTNFLTWPVPCDQTLQFNWAGASPQVSLFSADGRCVKHIVQPDSYGSGNYKIDVSDLVPGIYWMQCISKENHGIEKILIGR